MRRANLDIRGASTDRSAPAPPPAGSAPATVKPANAHAQASATARNGQRLPPARASVPLGSQRRQGRRLSMRMPAAKQRYDHSEFGRSPVSQKGKKKKRKDPKRILSEGSGSRRQARVSESAGRGAPTESISGWRRRLAGGNKAAAAQRRPGSPPPRSRASANMIGVQAEEWFCCMGGFPVCRKGQGVCPSCNKTPTDQMPYAPKTRADDNFACGRVAGSGLPMRPEQKLRLLQDGVIASDRTACRRPGLPLTAR